MATPLLLLAGFGWRGGPSETKTLGLVRWYTVLATAVALLSLAKAGSNYNYFLEVTTGLAIFAARGLDRLAKLACGAPSSPRHRWAPRFGRFTTVVGLVWMVGSFLLGAALLLAYASHPPDASELVHAIERTPGDVLTERDSLAVLRAGKEAVAADPLGVSMIAHAGHWDPAPLHTLIEDHAFSLIVLGRAVDTEASYQGLSWWPPGTRERIERHYRPIGRLGGNYLYGPIGSAEADTSAIAAEP